MATAALDTFPGELPGSARFLIGENKVTEAPCP